MKNTLADLNNHLFAQLERLNDENLSAEALDKELKRAQSVVSVSNAIVSNANVQMRAYEYMQDAGYNVASPELLGVKTKKINQIEAKNAKQ